MTPNMILSRPKNPQWLGGLRASAFGLALLVIGYGIANPPGSLLLLPGEAAAAAPAAPMSSPVPQADGSLAAAAVNEPQTVTRGDRNRWTDTSRECAPDAGVADACIYN